MRFTTNHVVPNPGEPITLAEISIFAKSGCKKCFGKGYETFVSTSREEDAKGKRVSKSVPVATMPCKCSIDRFLERFHTEVTAVSGAGLQWKAEEQNLGNEQKQEAVSGQ
jgi:hypothetical protein